MIGSSFSLRTNHGREKRHGSPPELARRWTRETKTCEDYYWKPWWWVAKQNIYGGETQKLQDAALRVLISHGWCRNWIVVGQFGTLFHTQRIELRCDSRLICVGMCQYERLTLRSAHLEEYNGLNCLSYYSNYSNIYTQFLQRRFSVSLVRLLLIYLYKIYYNYINSIMTGALSETRRTWSIEMGSTRNFSTIWTRSGFPNSRRASHLKNFRDHRKIFDMFRFSELNVKVSKIINRWKRVHLLRYVII